MATFVLVPGFWLGGWAWHPIDRRLREQGHDVYPVTLTGLGERVHLASPQVNLDTHITDVVNLIEFEDLTGVVLVGHSYAGVVVTGVSDRVPDRISQVVYLDSGPLPDGVAQLDAGGPVAKEFIEKRMAEHGDGWRFPMPSWDEIANFMGASLADLATEALHMFVPFAAGARRPARSRGAAEATKRG